MLACGWSENLEGGETIGEDPFNQTEGVLTSTSVPTEIPVPNPTSVPTETPAPRPTSLPTETLVPSPVPTPEETFEQNSAIKKIQESTESVAATKLIPLEEITTRLIEKYSERIPREWGEHFGGIRDRLDTTEKVAALTIDLCDNGFDEELFTFLQEEQIPATIFVSGIWIDNNPDIFMKLARQC